MSNFVMKPLDETTDAEKAFYARSILNLDLAPDAKPADIETAIRSAQPNVTQIFVEAAAPEAVQDQAPESAPDPNHVMHPEQLSDPRSQMDPAQVSDAVVRQVGSLGQNDPRVTIRIGKTDQVDGTGQSDVGVGVNGRVWQIKRGVDVSVPIRVLFALNNCEQDLVTHDPETFEVLINTSNRFPLSLPLGAPSRDEVREWFERTKDQFCP